MCVGVWERNSEGKFYKWLKKWLHGSGWPHGWLLVQQPSKIWGGCSLETKNMIDIDIDKQIYIYTQTHIKTCQKESFYGIL